MKINRSVASNVSISVRYHRPVFSKDEVMDYLKLKSWPRSMRHSVGWEEVKILLDEQKQFQQKKIGDLSYLCWILSPEFNFSKGGLYLTDMGHHCNWAREIKRRGQFNTEGLINHIHLDHTIRNRVCQFEIGVRAIRAWIPSLQQIAGLSNASIYLNGPKDYTLCIYSNPEKKDLIELDNKIANSAGTKLIITDAHRFIKWALG